MTRPGMLCPLLASSGSIHGFGVTLNWGAKPCLISSWTIATVAWKKSLWIILSCRKGVQLQFQVVMRPFVCSCRARMWSCRSIHLSLPASPIFVLQCGKWSHLWQWRYPASHTPFSTSVLTRFASSCLKILKSGHFPAGNGPFTQIIHPVETAVAISCTRPACPHLWLYQPFQNGKRGSTVGQCAPSTQKVQ